MCLCVVGCRTCSALVSCNDAQNMSSISLNLKYCISANWILVSNQSSLVLSLFSQLWGSSVVTCWMNLQVVCACLFMFDSSCTLAPRWDLRPSFTSSALALFSAPFHLPSLLFLSFNPCAHFLPLQRIHCLHNQSDFLWEVFSLDPLTPFLTSSHDLPHSSSLLLCIPLNLTHSFGSIFISLSPPPRSPTCNQCTVDERYDWT